MRCLVLMLNVIWLLWMVMLWMFGSLVNAFAGVVILVVIVVCVRWCRFESVLFFMVWLSWMMLM